ncbi:MAG TPA: DinB family protein [Saprospiraceae bacterium]|nr:DinB family protein [Saprospiraceae bacterium]
MEFKLDKALEILENTPSVLQALLANLSEDWYRANEGGESWSAYDIAGHLVHGEKTDWITRTKIILSDAPDKKFEPFDRFAQFRDSQGKTLEELILTFKMLRRDNLDFLKSLHLSEEDLQKTGIHPAFGTVTLEQLLATWVAHDLSHIAQIVRVMAKQYKEATGPWTAYLPLLTK